MGHIQHRPDKNRPHIARWRDLSGHPRSKSWGRRRDAERWLAHVDSCHADGREPGEHDDIPTLHRWLDQWLAGPIANRVESGSMKPSTAAEHEGSVRRYIHPQLTDRRLDKVTAADVEQMMAAIQQSGLSASTARKARSTLSRAYVDAVRAGHVRHNPARDVDLPPLPDPDVSIFSDDELAALRLAWTDVRFGSMFEVVSRTGLRAAEAYGLRWDRVDLDDATITIDTTLREVPSAPTVGIEAGKVELAPKTDGSAATIPVHGKVVATLRAHRKSQAAERLAASRWRDEGLVWTSPDGGPVTRSHVSDCWHAAGKAAGVDTHGRGLHELRRTLNTRLLDAGVAPHVVMQLLRWSSPDIMMRHYAGRVEASLRAAVEAVD